MDKLLLTRPEDEKNLRTEAHQPPAWGVGVDAGFSCLRASCRTAAMSCGRG